MPVFTVDQLRELGRSLLMAAGTPPAAAETVAEELAQANLVGHDSHGVMRLVQYVQMIHDGFVKPTAALEVIQHGPGYAVLDAHFSLGQVAAAKALELGLEQAQAVGTATILVRNCNHVGRLGSYGEQAARRGCLALMAVNAPGPGGVAPFGGIDRRLGTNPICMAAPRGDGAVVLDMTTSATAEGKLRVAFQKGEPIGEGLLINSCGEASINPADFYANPCGAILPLGGGMGHKGFGLAVMIDIFCGILSGSGVARTDLPRGANGVWLQLLEIERFLPRSVYDMWMDRYVAHLKDCRLQPGCAEILLPGEIEQRRRAERERDGIPIPEETLRQILETASRLGADVSFLSVEG
ncbi:MAG: Ldh family oxidoreductase [Planctomyces sp.]|nr:Ldh family oxidoreductase [Planctomyces sp.]